MCLTQVITTAAAQVGRSPWKAPMRQPHETLRDRTRLSQAHTQLEVFLANARNTRNLPGRKTDVQESQWLRKLHTYGLLRNSFRPPGEIRAVRTMK